MKPRFYASVAMSAVLAMAVAACGGSSGGSPSGSSSGDASGPAKITFLSGQVETDGASKIMTDVTKAYGHGSTIKIDVLTDPAQQDQKIQLLAGQDALPTIFHVGTPTLVKQLYQAGKIVDLEKVLTDLGVYDQLNPAAVDSLKKLYDGKLLTLPVELNIEGFWYNKSLFEQAGVQPPTTWDELKRVAATLDSKGIQPFSSSGKQGWPITRLVSGYLYRSLGPDAMQKVADGDAKLTDPDYVKAASEVAALGKDGYFGKGVASLDYTPAEDLFLQGKAAIFYMGSWALRDYNNAEMNKIGADNIGFFPFPTVAGGAGNADQTPTNAGLPIAVSAKHLDGPTKAWLKYVVQNYGNVAMSELGQITGVKVTEQSANVSPLTTQTLDQINTTTDAVAWFEALFPSQATTLSQSNAAGLVTGNTSPEKFMSTVQGGLG